MARPRKPKVGTVERLRADIGANWASYAFVEAKLRESGPVRGAMAAALSAAADRFGVSERTARRHWESLAPHMNPLLEATLPYLTDMEAAVNETKQALAGISFTASEQRELNEISLPITRKIAAVINAQRREIDRLRKPRRKRK